MKIAILSVLALTLAGQAVADDAAPPVDRTAALALTPKFTTEVTAALSQPLVGLYKAAEGGTAHEKWVYALALSADRHTIEPMPPEQRALYADYVHRVDVARAAYEKKHRNADTTTMGMDAFVKPTEAEILAVNMANRINNAEGWLSDVRAVPAAVAPDVLAQSLRCIDVVKSKVQADDLMGQLMQAAVTADGKPVAGSDVMEALSNGGDKSDEDLDNEAICGGADVFASDIKLMKAIYTPQFTISVSKK